jgi:hypothetical protein
MNLRSSGKTDAAKLFSEALQTTPARGLRIRKAWGSHAKNILVPFTPEALSLFTEAHLTNSLNTTIRSQTKLKNCSIYPSYHAIKASKEECYPSKDKILIYKSLVEVYLKAIVDKTAYRIIMAQKMPYILYWTIFRKKSFLFQNGVAMETLDTAN